MDLPDLGHNRRLPILQHRKSCRAVHAGKQRLIHRMHRAPLHRAPRHNLHQGQSHSQPDCRFRHRSHRHGARHLQRPFHTQNQQHGRLHGPERSHLLGNLWLPHAQAHRPVRSRVRNPQSLLLRPAHRHSVSFHRPRAESFIGFAQPARGLSQHYLPQHHLLLHLFRPLEPCHQKDWGYKNRQLRLPQPHLHHSGQFPRSQRINHHSCLSGVHHDSLRSVCRQQKIGKALFPDKQKRDCAQSSFFLLAHSPKDNAHTEKQIPNSKFKKPQKFYLPLTSVNKRREMIRESPKATVPPAYFSNGIPQSAKNIPKTTSTPCIRIIRWARRE